MRGYEGRGFCSQAAGGRQYEVKRKGGRTRMRRVLCVRTRGRGDFAMGRAVVSPKLKAVAEWEGHGGGGGKQRRRQGCKLFAAIVRGMLGAATPLRSRHIIGRFGRVRDCEWTMGTRRIRGHPAGTQRTSRRAQIFFELTHRPPTGAPAPPCAPFGSPNSNCDDSIGHFL